MKLNAKKKNIKESPADGIELSLEKVEADAASGLGIMPVLVLILGIYGYLCLVASVFRLEYHQILIYLLPLLYGGVFSAVFFRGGRKYVPVLVIMAVWAAVGFMFWDSLWCGLALMINQGLTAIGQSQGINIKPLAVAVPVHPEIYTALALSFIMLPVALLLSYATVYRYNLFVPVLVASPVLEVGFYYDLKPGLVPFALMVAFMLAVIVMQQISRRPPSQKNANFYDERSRLVLHRNAGDIGLAMAFFLGFVLIALGLLVPEQSYNNYMRTSPVIARIDQVFDKDFWIQILSSHRTEIHGGITGGKLSEANEYTFSGATDLIVTADKLRNSIYLRGFVGAGYTGDSWEGLSGKEDAVYDEMAAQIGLQPWELSCRLLDLNAQLLSPVLQAEKRSISVKNINAPGQYAYVPYNALYEKGLNLTAGGQAEIRGSSYTTDYYDIINYDNNVFLNNRANIRSTLLGNLGNSGGSVTREEINAYFEKEERYAEYVHDVYTGLPDNLPVQLVSDFGSLSYPNIEALIKTVTGRLSAMAAYTLSPGAVPAGKDFVGYFLYENKKGYCTQFATTATLIFRMAGIPARYVEGYVVTVDDYTNAENQNGQYTMNVKDSNSHAWVELYLDGFGWVPVEVTPGFTSLVSTDNDVSGQTADYEVSAGRSSNDINVTTPVVEEGGNNGLQAESKDGENNDDGGQDSFNTVWLILGAGLTLLILFAAVLLRRRIILSNRRRNINGKNLNTSVLAAYASIVSLIRYAGISRAEYISEQEFARVAERLDMVPEDSMAKAVEVVLKAAFSEKGVREEERETLAELERELARRTYLSGTRLNRLKLKFIFVYV